MFREMENVDFFPLNIVVIWTHRGYVAWTASRSRGGKNSFSACSLIDCVMYLWQNLMHLETSEFTKVQKYYIYIYVHKLVVKSYKKKPEGRLNSSFCWWIRWTEYN